MPQKKYRTAFFLILIVIAQLLIRIPFYLEPLECDEGVFGYMAQTLLRGGQIYRDAVDNKPPLVFFIYAFIIKFMGGSIFSIRLFTALFGCLSTVALFFIGRQLFGNTGALLASTIFAVFCGGPFVQGTAANCENFMILFILLAQLSYLRGERWVLAGAMLGLAMLAKQTAAIYFLPFLVFIFYSGGKRISKFFALVIGAGAVGLLLAGYLIYNGIFRDFIECVFTINYKYFGSLPPLNHKTLNILYLMHYENSVIWVLGSAAAVYIFLKDRKKELLFLAVWTIFAFAAVCLPGHYFGHYFIQLVPCLALLSAYAVLKIRPDPVFTAAMAVLLFFIGINLYPFYFKFNPLEISTQKYSNNIFCHALKAGNDIKNNSRPEDCIFVWGMEAEIYYYSQRRCPGRYFYITGGFKRGYFTLQKNEVMKDLIKNPPKFIVYSFLPAYFEELEKFTAKKYRLLERYGNKLEVYARI